MQSPCELGDGGLAFGAVLGVEHAARGINGFETALQDGEGVCDAFQILIVANGFHRMP